MAPRLLKQHSQAPVLAAHSPLSLVEDVCLL